MAQAKWLEQVRTFFKRTKTPQLSEEQVAKIDVARKEYEEWFSKGHRLVKDLKGCAIRSQGAMDKLNAACEETMAHPLSVPALHMMVAAFATIILSERDQEEGFKELQWFVQLRLSKVSGSKFISEFLTQSAAILALQRDGLFDFYQIQCYPERFFDVPRENTASTDASVSGS